MTQPRRIHVNIDRLVVGETLDEEGLRAAIAAGLGGRLTGESDDQSRPGRREVAVASRVVRRIQQSLPHNPGTTPR